MDDCIFCMIAEGKIPSQKVYENEWAYCFKDINPQAAVHVLVVPKKHVANAAEGSDAGMMEHLCAAAVEVAKMMGIDKTGYRIVMNTGDDARQSVHHLHLHVLGGQQLSDQMV